MTPEQTKQAIEVMRAFLDGAAIEYRDRGGSGGWEECAATPGWVWSNTEYRVKPEPPKPREWWEIKEQPALEFVQACSAFTHALRYVQSHPEKHLTVFHVREVKEETK